MCAKLWKPRITFALMALSVVLDCLPLAAQSPTGGSVTSGTATINQSSNTTTINQSSLAASINWQSFSIGSTSTVNFNQPSSSAVTLNRVVGSELSVIEGVLNANGHVFLLNGNGILMTKGSSINTAGFVASTLNLTDDDFRAGKYIFRANGSTGSVINLGTITAKDGGYVALLGNKVSNQGLIVATKGTVALASGDQITLDFNGDSLIGVTIDQGALDALVENKQAIYADGGTVILTAKSADDLLNAQVNNSGVIQARTLGDLKGDIRLLADGGTVAVGGTLDASAPNGGDGGTIETSGNKVAVSDDAIITTLATSGTTGTWVIDPDGFTISATDGDISGATLSKELATTDVIIKSTDGSGTDGNVNVEDSVSWSSNRSLTLEATNNINVDSTISATGASSSLRLEAGNDININNAVTLSGMNAALTMSYGDAYNILTSASYSGAVLDSSGTPVANTDTSNGVYGSVTLSGDNASLTINGNAYTLIHSMSQLDALDGYNASTGTGSASTVSGYYALASNLDASGTTYSNALIESFSGTLAGLGHTISNLTIDAPTVYNIGLIGSASGSTLRDIGLTNANITGYGNVGALLGYGTTTDTSEFTVSGDYSTGSVTATGGSVGGLIGSLIGGPELATISHSYSSADVTSTASDVYTYDDTGTIVTSVEVVSPDAGGLIGNATYTYITNSDATGAVTAVTGHAGGLAGQVSGAYYGSSGYSSSITPTVTMSYATGNVKETTTSSNDWAAATGGLIGYGLMTDVTSSFASGNVSGYDQVGGLMGVQDSNTSYLNPSYYISNTYATGNVSSIGAIPYADSSHEGTATGGLIGYCNGTNVSNSFATGNVTSTYVQPGAVDAYQVNVGGLIGDFTGGTISNSHATGKVNGAMDGYASGVGGLVGSLDMGTVINSYASGDVTGSVDVGGLVGRLYSLIWAGDDTTASVINSSSYGDVYGITAVGGIVGGSIGITNDNASDYNVLISGDSSYGNVTGTGSYVGGIIGYGENLAITGSNAYGVAEGLTDVGGVAGYTDNVSITDSTGWGEVQSNLVNFSSANAAASTMSNQTGDYSLSEAQEDADQTTPRQPTADSVNEKVVFDDSSDYSVTIKTVVVDGVEYQVTDDSAASTDDQKKNKKQ